MTVNLVNRKGEIVASLEIEDATATRREIEAHYTKFARIFMRQYGIDLQARIA